MRRLLSLLTAAVLVSAAPANAQTTDASTLGVIGDVPYGAAQIAGQQIVREDVELREIQEIPR